MCFIITISESLKILFNRFGTFDIFLILVTFCRSFGSNLQQVFSAFSASLSTFVFIATDYYETFRFVHTVTVRGQHTDSVAGVAGFHSRLYRVSIRMFVGLEFMCYMHLMQCNIDWRTCNDETQPHI